MSESNKLEKINLIPCSLGSMVRNLTLMMPEESNDKIRLIVANALGYPSWEQAQQATSSVHPKNSLDERSKSHPNQGTHEIKKFSLTRIYSDTIDGVMTETYEDESLNKMLSKASDFLVSEDILADAIDAQCDKTCSASIQKHLKNVIPFISDLRSKTLAYLISTRYSDEVELSLILTPLEKLSLYFDHFSYEESMELNFDPGLIIERYVNQMPVCVFPDISHVVNFDPCSKTLSSWLYNDQDIFSVCLPMYKGQPWRSIEELLSKQKIEEIMKVCTE